MSNINIIKNYIKAKIPNKYLYGYEYNNTLKEIEKVNEMAIHDQREYQLLKIVDMVNYVKNHVPYYKKMINGIEIKTLEDFEKIKCIDKEVIRENMDDLQTTEKLNCTLVRSGGTTGTPMSFYLDKKINIQELAYIDYYWNKFNGNYSNTSKIAILRGLTPRGNKLFEKNSNKLILSSFKLSSDNFNVYVKAIEDFDPEFIHIYPSSMHTLSEHILSNKIDLNIKSLKGIFSSSESLFETQRNIIEKAFKTKMLDLYGHSERCIIAFDNGTENYNLDMSYGYVEVLDQNNRNIILEKDSIGELVVTGFRNKSMPLIRYRTGDMAITSGKYNSIKKIIGRTSDCFVDKNNNKITFTYLGTIFYDVEEKIERYQFIQNEIGKANLLIEEIEKLTESDIKLIINKFNKYYNNIELNVDTSKKIERTERGKFKYLVQNLKI